MNCSDCKELYKERKQEPPCLSCPINAEMDAEQANAEYLCAEEQAQAEAEEITRLEAESEVDPYFGSDMQEDYP